MSPFIFLFFYFHLFMSFYITFSHTHFVSLFFQFYTFSSFTIALQLPVSHPKLLPLHFSPTISIPLSQFLSLSLYFSCCHILLFFLYISLSFFTLSLSFLLTQIRIVNYSSFNILCPYLFLPPFLSLSLSVNRDIYGYLKQLSLSRTSV